MVKLSPPRILLHAEGLAVLVVSLIAYAELGDSWIRFAIWFLAPDLFMVGYLAGPRMGAFIYNLAHTYVAPVICWLFVYFAHWPSFTSLIIIWVAHIAFDRLLGYGLKYGTAFESTHFKRV